MVKRICVLFVITAAFFAGCKSDDSSVTPTNTNHAPNAPSEPTPRDAATNVSSPVTLSWQCTDPDAGDELSYDVYEGTTNPPSMAVATDLKHSTYSLGPISPNTVIYWKVKAKDNNGATTEGPVWWFKTGN